MHTGRPKQSKRREQRRGGLTVVPKNTGGLSLTGAAVLRVGSSHHQHPHDLRTCQICKFSSPTPDLLNQKLFGGMLVIHGVTSPLGGSAAYSTWRVPDKGRWHMGAHEAGNQLEKNICSAAVWWSVLTRGHSQSLSPFSFPLPCL